MNVTMPSNLQMILGLYAYLLPLLLYVLWTTLALWDLGRRAETPATATWIWVDSDIRSALRLGRSPIFSSAARSWPRGSR